MKKRNKFFSDKVRKELEKVYNSEFISDMEDCFSHPLLTLPMSEHLRIIKKYAKKLDLGRLTHNKSLNSLNFK